MEIIEIVITATVPDTVLLHCCSYATQALGALLV